MAELTFEKLDNLLHGKLSLIIQYARELAEEHERMDVYAEILIR